MKTVYTTEVRSTGGRTNGQVVSDDGALDLAVSPPPGLGGDGAGTNPEQLFAAGYAACFDSALHGVAERLGLSISDASVTVTVDLRKGSDGFSLAVTILVAARGADEAQLRQLVETTTTVCPYSRATAGNVPHTLEVEVLD